MTNIIDLHKTPIILEIDVVVVVLTLVVEVEVLIDLLWYVNFVNILGILLLNVANWLAFLRRIICL